MDALPSPSRSRSYDIPKPEADLTEWTNKIKALQRQVDADDEAEQRRLEEEIAAARRARLRRSRGAESVASVDLSRITNETSVSPSRSDVDRTIAEKQVHQADTLRRLTNTEHNGQDAAVVDADVEKPPSRMQEAASVKRESEPMSLAAFIGGRATGPRLNKHTPQQDAVDPAQFEQRTNIVAPHPVFGRGGIAMPGMVGQRPSAVRSQPPVATHPHTPPIVEWRAEKAREPSATSRKTGDEENRLASRKPGDRTEIIVTPWTGTSEQRTLSRRPGMQGHAVFPQKAGEKEQSALRQDTISRERAISTPAVSYPTRDGGRPLSRASERMLSQYQGVRSGTPNNDRGITPSSSPSMVSSVNVVYSPKVSPLVQRFPTTPPYFARPIQPDLRPSTQPAPSVVPSPAFLKPLAPKELTPSISRLQGRGFVQSMVKISSQLENSAAVPPTPPTKPRGTRKSSVLDRWQPVMVSSSVPSPPLSPKSVTFSKTVAPPPVTSNVPRPSSTEPVKRFLRTRASLPSISQGLPETSGAELERNASLLRRMPPDGTPGLGSATTMAIYKPSSSPETEFANVDELGVRKQPLSTEDVRKTSVSIEFPPSGKPLSHPTKDRAKKPRKVKDTRIASQEQGKVMPIRDQGSVMADVQPSSGHATVGSETLESAEGSVDIPTDADKRLVSPYPKNKVPGSSNASSRWTEAALITVPAASPVTSSVPSEKRKRDTHFGKALPGLISQHKATELVPITSPKSPSQITKLRDHVANFQPVQAAVRHSRTSGAGNRPTAMDLALAFGQQPEDDKTSTFHEPQGPDAQVILVLRATSPEHKIEKRKPILDRYSSIMLPVLKEETTPTTSPSGTLSRNTVPFRSISFGDDFRSTRQTELSSGPVIAKVVHLDHIDEPLPNVNIDELLESRPHPELSSPHSQTISVEVLNIIGLAVTAISLNTNIFYDTELLAIVHRFKSKIDGLVSTGLWIWQGKHCQTSDKEGHKIQELARRYGTNAEIVSQCSEPPQLVHLLGGWLAIRQGSRNHWSPENTTMHLVRQNSGVIYIDELDLSMKNLCSAFSYCLSILNTVYIWHGCGAIEAERQAALQYARDFLPESQGPVELDEGEGDDDEIFWMILGGQDYAKADYWKWRKESLLTDPIAWHVQAREVPPIVSQMFLSLSQASFQDGVYIIDCIWEFFVLVGCRARGNRQDIKLGLDVAMNMSRKLSPNRPFPPTVHVLILPSRLPLDLRLHYRNFDEWILNDGNVPNHMNILSAAEASEHLQRTSWETTTLEDERMLPLGIGSLH
ncbi:hypothetical protein AX15_006803 [Amanita polypyramis BW_CC]|nr:hypothetical protein AX15_006803 [Amanita polypyramis BW_CC]